MRAFQGQGLLFYDRLSAYARVMASQALGNLDAAGRRQRLLMGIALLLVAAGLGWWLVTSGAAIWARVVLFGPLFIGGLGLFQGLADT